MIVSYIHSNLYLYRQVLRWIFEKSAPDSHALDPQLSSYAVMLSVAISHPYAKFSYKYIQCTHLAAKSAWVDDKVLNCGLTIARPRIMELQKSTFCNLVSRLEQRNVFDVVMESH